MAPQRIRKPLFFCTGSGWRAACWSNPARGSRDRRHPFTAPNGPTTVILTQMPHHRGVAPNVLDHRAPGSAGLAAADRLDDRAVLEEVPPGHLGNLTDRALAEFPKLAEEVLQALLQHAVPRGVRDREVELDVGARVDAPRGDLPFELGRPRLDRGEVFPRRSARRELGRLALDALADLQQVEERGPLDALDGQLLVAQVFQRARCTGQHDRPSARPRVDQPEGDQPAQGLSDARPPDAQHPHELVLARESVTRAEGAVADLGQDLVEDDLGEWDSGGRL
jgi:hypothetical protein